MKLFQPSGTGQAAGCWLFALKRAALLSALIVIVSGCSLPRIVVVKDPLSPEEHINLGVAYERKGEYDLAIREYKRAARGLSIAYFYLGNAYFKKGDYREAEHYYRLSIRKNPDHADSLNNLAWLYYTEGRRLAEAERLVLRAIRLNPEKKSVYLDTLRKIREKRGL